MRITKHPVELQTADVTTAAVSDMSDFGFTADLLTTANGAIVTCATNDCMVTFDGTDPTATLGHILDAAQGPGDWLYVDSPHAIQDMKFLGSGGTSVVSITLLRGV